MPTLKRVGMFLGIFWVIVPQEGVRAAPRQPIRSIHVAVSPATSVRSGTTVVVSATTSRPVSDIWVFDGSISDIVNVAYVASCDAPPSGSVTHCSGHARYSHGVIRLPDPPYRQSKKSGNRQAFFACWNSIAPPNCSKPVTVTWKTD